MNLLSRLGAAAYSWSLAYSLVAVQTQAEGDTACRRPSETTLNGLTVTLTCYIALYFQVISNLFKLNVN